MPQYFIGLMSGTSLDGVDAVLADFAPDVALNAAPAVLAHASLPMPADLRRELLALHTPSHNELHRAAMAAQALARLYAQACHEALAQSGLPASSIQAIGAHGQTVRHQPGSGYTLQLNAPALLAELTGIRVVADFRARDMAAGGQGAPLAPILHQALFQQTGRVRVVLNLGGIANITVLPARGSAQAVQGFDTGPANMLLDAWFQRHHPNHGDGAGYDENGRWAASGLCNDRLLAYLIQSEPWFALPAPKSTGRDMFSLHWLDERLGHAPVSVQTSTAQTLRPQDVQATLQALTVHTVVQAIAQVAPHASSPVGEVVVCGGGACNTGLMATLHEQLRAQLSCPLARTDDYGLPAQQVEALAFAWLARAHLLGQPGNLAAVTGARGSRILGCVYPA